MSNTTDICPVYQMIDGVWKKVTAFKMVNGNWTKISNRYGDETTSVLLTADDQVFIDANGDKFKVMEV